MPTSPTAFAQTTRISANPLELRKRVLSLYRQFLRGANEFAEMYDIDQRAPVIRTKIRQEFERNRYIQDIHVANIAYAKGHMEYQESINFWKQQSHVLKYFQEEEATHHRPKPQDFVSRFIRGTA